MLWASWWGQGNRIVLLVPARQIFESLYKLYHRGAGWTRTHDRQIMRSTGFGHRTHYLHGYHGVVPPMALIALFARVTRSTNRSTLTTAIAGYQLQNVTADRGLVCQGYGRWATWSIWTTRRSSSIV
jgi:hypothetical protein